jgi:hypothetical protein
MSTLIPFRDSPRDEAAKSLLFATLLLVRLLGYRLQRVATTEIRVEDLKSAAAGLPPGAYALLAKGR